MKGGWKVGWKLRRIQSERKTFLVVGNTGCMPEGDSQCGGGWEGIDPLGGRTGNKFQRKKQRKRRQHRRFVLGSGEIPFGSCKLKDGGREGGRAAAGMR